MDPFVEKDLIDCLKSIALGLKDIKAELQELTNAVRESSIAFEEEIEESDEIDAESD